MNNNLSATKNRKYWTSHAISKLFVLPLLELLFQAQGIHRKNFASNTLQIAQLLNIKTGGCPEDCGYCSQSAHYKTGLSKQDLMDTKKIVQFAQAAKDAGVQRLCMAAAWRSPPQKSMEKLTEIIQAVKKLGLETCMTLGMLSEEQVQTLSQAGLDFYNHNLDTSPRYYKKIITTRNFQERIDTLDKVRRAGIKLCTGGILGMGEEREDRIELLKILANLIPAPESVPLNLLVPIFGTPLGDTLPIKHLEFVRTVAVARIIMPNSVIRLSAGRSTMGDAVQVLCFLAGANSIHFGEKLLTQKNVEVEEDKAFLKKLKIKCSLKD